ncbi:MAG: hypothetical protein IJT59_00800, partial [Desulfovibrionaceae bacterium]|nr:hypothetical protein [Desulfovibrionaceae bacterium]
MRTALMLLSLILAGVSFLASPKDLWALDKVVYEEALSLPTNIPRSTVEVALQGRAFLHAIKKEALAIPERRSLLLQVDEEDLPAITALLYQVEISTSLDESGKNLHALITSKRDPNALELARLTLRNPELLAASRYCLEKIGDILVSFDQHWPKARFFSDRDAKISIQHYSAETSAWTNAVWQRLTDNLHALLIAHQAITPAVDGWFTQEKFLKSLEEANQKLPNDPLILTLLAEAELRNGSPHQAIDHCSQCLKINPQAIRARYIRALAHWNLQQLGLAENDLSVAILKIKPQETAREDLLLALRARGAVRLLLGRYQGMCVDFETACSFGDCDGLRHARLLEHCVPGQPTIDRPHTAIAELEPWVTKEALTPKELPTDKLEPKAPSAANNIQQKVVNKEPINIKNEKSVLSKEDSNRKDLEQKNKTKALDATINPDEKEKLLAQGNLDSKNVSKKNDAKPNNLDNTKKESDNTKDNLKSVREFKSDPIKDGSAKNKIDLANLKKETENQKSEKFATTKKLPLEFKNSSAKRRHFAWFWKPETELNKKNTILTYADNSKNTNLNITLSPRRSYFPWIWSLNSTQKKELERLKVALTNEQLPKTQDTKKELPQDDLSAPIKEKSSPRKSFVWSWQPEAKLAIRNLYGAEPKKEEAKKEVIATSEKPDSNQDPQTTTTHLNDTPKEEAEISTDKKAQPSPKSTELAQEPKAKEEPKVAKTNLDSKPAAKNLPKNLGEKAGEKPIDAPKKPLEDAPKDSSQATTTDKLGPRASEKTAATQDAKEASLDSKDVSLDSKKDGGLESKDNGVNPKDTSLNSKDSSQAKDNAVDSKKDSKETPGTAKNEPNEAEPAIALEPLEKTSSSDSGEKIGEKPTDAPKTSSDDTPKDSPKSLATTTDKLGPRASEKTAATQDAKEASLDSKDVILDSKDNGVNLKDTSLNSKDSSQAKDNALDSMKDSKDAPGTAKNEPNEAEPAIALEPLEKTSSSDSGEKIGEKPTDAPKTSSDDTPKD